jgi:hypothetical protein
MFNMVWSQFVLVLGTGVDGSLHFTNCDILIRKFASVATSAQIFSNMIGLVLCYYGRRGTRFLLDGAEYGIP